MVDRAGEYDINYKMIGAMNSQVVEDFMVELTPTKEKESPKVPPPLGEGSWTLLVDGLSINQASKVGIILTTPGGAKLEYVVSFSFKVTDNEA